MAQPKIEYVDVPAVNETYADTVQGMMFDGQSVPVRDVTPTVPMTADQLEKYYPKKDGVWTPDFAAIAKLPTKSDCTKV